MRRLPVYLVLDVSISMQGEPIESVKNGLQLLIDGLRQNPFALETAYISVIIFSDGAIQVCPLTELTEFIIPELEAGGRTSLGDALSLLTECIEREVLNSAAGIKGDWKPLIFLMTDGGPTDDWRMGFEKFKKKECGVVLACGAGKYARTNVLKEITSEVVQLDDMDTHTIGAYFKWVTSAIISSSIQVENSKNDVFGISELPPPPPEVNIVF